MSKSPASPIIPPMLQEILDVTHNPSDSHRQLFKELAEAAKELAEVTSNLVTEITQRQTYLQSVKVPLETWVTIQEEEYDHDTGEDDTTGGPVYEPRSDELELGWRRDGGKEWVLAVRETRRKEVSDNVGTRRWKTVSTGESTRLLEASREHQLLALEHFTDLVEALTRSAKQKVANIRAAKA